MTEPPRCSCADSFKVYLAWTHELWALWVGEISLHETSIKTSPAYPPRLNQPNHGITTPVLKEYSGGPTSLKNQDFSSKGKHRKCWVLEFLKNSINSDTFHAKFSYMIMKKWQGWLPSELKKQKTKTRQCKFLMHISHRGFDGPN